MADPRGSPDTPLDQISCSFRKNNGLALPSLLLASHMGNPGSVTGTGTKRKRNFPGATQQIISICSSPVHRNSLATVICKYFWSRKYEATRMHYSRMYAALLLTISRSIWWGDLPNPLLDADPHWMQTPPVKWSMMHAGMPPLPLWT